MPSAISVLLIDDLIGEEGSTHQRAFQRAHGDVSVEFRYCTARDAKGYSSKAAVDAVAAAGKTDLILLDLSFGDRGDRLGLEILREIGARHPEVPVLILSALDRDVAVLGRCLEEGAIGFIEKSAKPAALQAAIHRALEMAHSHVLIGKSEPLRELRRQAARLSPYDQIPVLIVGERGTGKERVARYIHQNSPRRGKPFVAVNCAAIPETLIESEFFGAEQGAYTGATSRRAGYFERANGGVLFLDEIGDMPLMTQAKLLRVLQDGAYRRVGSSEEELTANFQLICATNVEPNDLLAKGKLREDFHDRVAAVTVRTPALRECKGDIPDMCAHFLRMLGLAGLKRLSAKVIDRFTEFDWPGNVRQLQRAVQESVVRSEDIPEIGVEHLPEFLRPKFSAVGHPKDVSAFETGLPIEPRDWAQARILAEIALAVEAKRRIRMYKGTQWKAEFMRMMYPECKAANAKGFQDLLRRLTKGPWGMPAILTDSKAKQLIHELEEP